MGPGGSKATHFGDREARGIAVEYTLDAIEPKDGRREIAEREVRESAIKRVANAC